MSLFAKEVAVRQVALIALLLTSLLAGCGSAAGPGAAADPAIVYERSGGIAGAREEWAVYPDGRIVAPDDGKRTVPAPVVTGLVAGLEKAGFFELQDSYGAGGSCRDCFTVALTVRSGAKVKKVTAVVEDVATPAEVKAIIEMVEKVLRGQ